MQGGDSASQSTSSGAKETSTDAREDSVFSREGEPMDSAEMAIINKSPGSSNHDLKADHEAAEDDMEAEENVENTTPGVSAIYQMLQLNPVGGIYSRCYQR